MNETKEPHTNNNNTPIHLTTTIRITPSSSLHMQNQQLHQHNNAAHINSPHTHCCATTADLAPHLPKRSLESQDSSTVQYLNNRGCVNVTMGNYPEANRLFELALHQQMAITQSATVSSSSPTPTPPCSSLDQRNTVDDDAPSHYAIHRINSSSDYEDDYDYDDDISLDSDIDDRSCESDSDMTDDDDLDDFEVYDPSNYRGAHRIQRMTTSSKLPISSFCGQNSHMHHEVYCLPIVMDDMEWESASIDDKTFVLIFNTAVCNHLWGMYFQQQEEEEQQHHHKQQGHDDDNEDDQSKRAFLAAHQLYRLALSNGNKVGRSTPNETGNPAVCSSSSIDYQLCLVAVLNNLSHISKTLVGTDSYEAHQFDRMLLKAIFWWRDSRDQRRASPAWIDSNDLTTNYGIYDYEDGDTEIIDLFLEYVFYQIGVSEAVAPAASA